MSDGRDPQRGEPRAFIWTLGKVLLSLVLAFAALVALAATVCGFLLGRGMGTHGWSFAGVGAVVLGLLVYAIIRIWR